MKIKKVELYSGMYNKKPYSFNKKKNKPNNDSSKFKEIFNIEIEKLNTRGKENKRSK